MNVIPTGRLIAALLPACVATASAAAEGGRCEAISGPQQALLVELFTSEGCSSCPPADRWLSSLKGRPGVLAAAFHVQYWDHLGWRDRFASAAATERQAQQQPRSGARYRYTPQVLVNGRDWRRWPELPAGTVPAPVQLRLQRDAADRVDVLVTPLAQAPATLAAWWAVLEDGHASRVKAGENSGATLQHDHVVRAYAQRPAWSTAAPQRWTLEAPRRGEAGRLARLLLVVTDGRSGAPLQAVQLDC